MADYKECVKESLTRVFAKYKENAIPIDDVRNEKWIIFSDHHRGQEDGADDFKKCKAIYHAALGYYLNAGYKLFLLGDVEDLWECFPRKVIRHYEDTLNFEKNFLEGGRYFRLIGNHDDLWCKPAKVKKYLKKYINQDSVDLGKAYEIKLNGQSHYLFLAHGHQGDLANDRISWLSRFFVRYFWRPFQVITHIGSTTPANDFEMRDKHEKAMYEWAVENRVMLICGDTHHPVFASEVHEDTIRDEITKLEKKLTAAKDRKEKKSLQEEINYKHADLEWMHVRSGVKGYSWVEDGEELKPCYFNSGTCSFSDGDITGIEIVDGKILLVRWPDDQNDPRKKILREADLTDLITSFSSSSSPPAGISRSF